MELLLTLLAMLLLLLLQGFFSGSEIALVNADKLKLRHRAKQGHNGCRLVLKQFERPERLLATTLVGTNISTVSLATLGTVMTIRHIGSGGDVLAFLLITPLMLVFGEVVPKSVYQQKADTLAPIIIYPLRVFSWLFFPLIFVFSNLARLIAKLVSDKQSASELFVGREKIRSLLESAEQAPSTDIFDHQRIRRAIRFSDITTVDAMIPLSDAIVINSEHSLSHAIEQVYKTGYNRIPVYDVDASRIMGILVLTDWDLLDPDLEKRSINDFLSPALFVPPSQQVEKLLPELQARDDHMAVVVDEFGSAIGILTVEDIVEEVVGEIEDVDFRLHHPYKPTTQELGNNRFKVDAHLPINELNDLLNLKIPVHEYHTVGGLLVTELRRIPKKDETVVKFGYQFTAIESDERMVKRVLVEPKS